MLIVLILKAIKKAGWKSKKNERKISSDLWFSLSDIKVNLKQLSEKFMSEKFLTLKEHMLPNSIEAFLDILRNI